jgi:flagellar protein FliS
MDPNGYHSSWERQIRTGTPQSLQLMLIEGALRFADETVRHWDTEDGEAAFESLNRCRRIVSELLHNVRPAMSQPAKQAAQVYLFLFQTLTDIQLHGERQRMAEVVKVLESERETWQTVCDEMPQAPRWVERPAVEAVTCSGLEDLFPDVSASEPLNVPIPPGGSLSVEA